MQSQTSYVFITAMIKCVINGMKLEDAGREPKEIGEWSHI